MLVRQLPGLATIGCPSADPKKRFDSHQTKNPTRSTYELFDETNRIACSKNNAVIKDGTSRRFGQNVSKILELRNGMSTYAFFGIHETIYQPTIHSRNKLLLKAYDLRRIIDGNNHTVAFDGRDFVYIIRIDQAISILVSVRNRLPVSRFHTSFQEAYFH